MSRTRVREVSVDFMGSAGMAALADAFQECEQVGGWLRVVADDGHARRLAMVGLDKVLNVRPTISDALQVDDRADDRTADQSGPTL